MLSILIPIYNYTVFNLLNSLDIATKDLDFDYEILCCEDGSQLYLDDNKTACNSIKNTTHLILSKNNGSILTRKLLAKKAKYDWLLFLDADVELVNDNLINNYSNYLKHKYDAIYGGCSYDQTPPDSEYMLRWKYGLKYEQVSAVSRNLKPFKHLVSANFLIKKDIFLKASFEIKNRAYGNDLLFASILKSHQSNILHIDNAVIHKGFDNNLEFLNKSKIAVNTLFKMYLSENKTESSLLHLFKRLKAFGLTKIIALLFNFSEKSIKSNLLSGDPKIKLLQFYKLGYLCSLSLNKE
ncbi:glycosyltransferase family 2 protein [uncultured Winogradskyella sp.]|uniref:glycosyltransferase family 2 protein n=1 Tax=uncultured Winogradskyella sp. TaxID=395353 RepID=UPI002638C62F|nr:glycosyltransferase family 2 protein [uncultured Winogradskyella sp.]